MEELILKSLQEIANQLEKINEKTANNSFIPISKKDIQRKYGLSDKIMRDMFNDPKFPAQRQGKEDMATMKAVEEYFSVRHERN